MSDSSSTAAPAAETFDDEFNSLSLWNGTSGTWSTEFIYADPNGNGSSLPSNGEQEWYINNNYAPTSSVTPWTVNNGILTITAAPTNPGVSQYLGYNQPGLPAMGSYQYTSGLLETSHSFAQTYGYFEMRAELPAGQGLWPAFWLLPASGAWPPELDVMEVLGSTPNTLYTSIHSNETGVETSAGVGTNVANTAAGYHTYAVDWEANTVTYYFDGQQVYQVPTPSDMHQAMYMLVNLAVGGNWPGDANSTTPLPAEMNVDYVRAYASMPDAAQLATDQAGSTNAVTTPPQDLPYPDNFVQTLFETVLLRPGNEGELSYWANEISSGAMSTGQVVAAVVGSSETQTMVQPIVQLYQAFFDRAPDAAGLGFWVNALRSGESLNAIASQFAAAPEFQHHYGADLSPTVFLNVLYENALGRAPDSGGEQYWLGLLGAAPSPAADAGVALGVVGSVPFQTETTAAIDAWLTAAGTSGAYDGSIAYFSTASVTASTGQAITAITAATAAGAIGIDLSAPIGANEITALNGGASQQVATDLQNVDLSALTGPYGTDITASPDGSTIIGSHFADTIDLSSSGSGVNTVGLSGNVYTGLSAAAPGTGTFAYTSVANFDTAGRTDLLALDTPYAATLTGGVAGASAVTAGTVDTTTGHNVFFVAPSGTSATLTDPASAAAAIGAVTTGATDTFVVILDNGASAASSTQFGVYEVTAHDTGAALGTSPADTIKLLGLFSAPGGFDAANYHTPISS